MSFSSDDDYSSEEGEGFGGCNMGDFADDFSDDEGAADLATETESLPPRNSASASAAAAGLGAAAAGESASTLAVQTLSGEKRLPLSAAGTAMLEQMRSNIKTVTVLYKIEASPHELANGKTPRLELPKNTHGVFDDAASAEKRSTSHVLYNAKMTHFRNEFPFDIGLDVCCGDFQHASPVGEVLVPGKDGKALKTNVLIPANQSSTFSPSAGSNAPTVVHGNGESVDQKGFAQQYPGYNMSNLRQGLTTVVDPQTQLKKVLIPYAHPVTKYYNSIRHKQGVRPIDKSDFTPGMQMYAALPEDTDEVLETIEQSLKSGTGNLHEIHFDLKRLHGSIPAGASAPAFDDTEELSCKFAAATSASAAVQQKKMLVVGIQYTFRHS